MKLFKEFERTIRGWLPQEPSSITLPHKSKLRNMRKPIKYSKVNIVFISFMAILLLSVFAQIEFQANIPSNYYPEYYIRAENLNVEPEKYFELSNPDQYVLRAINGEHGVLAPQKDTQILDLQRQYGTSNIVYNGSYYTIQIAFVDSFPPITLPYILAGFAISILGIAVICMLKVSIHLKLPKK